MGRHDSDWFSGYHDCDDYPCKIAVAAQKLVMDEERVRGALITAYYEHHKKWPQSSFIDTVLKVMR